MRYNIIRSLVYWVFSIAIITFCSCEILLAEPTPLELQTGFQVQLIPLQTTITDNEKMQVIINIKNDTESPISDIKIISQISDLKVEGPVTVAQLQPHSSKNIEILLSKQGGKPRNDINAVFEFQYSTILNSGEKYQGQLFHTLPLKINSIENTNISGIPLFFASYIIPGLFTIILLGVFVNPLPEVIKDNKYWIAIPLSVLQVIILRYLLPKLQLPKLQFGDTMQDFMIYTISGVTLGALLGYIWNLSRPLYVRYPAEVGMSIGELLEIYVKQNRTANVTLTTVTDRSIQYVGLMVKTRGEKEVILLPMQYKLTINNDRKKKQFNAAKNLAAIAKHLRKLSVERKEIQVVDGIKSRSKDGEESLIKEWNKTKTFQGKIECVTEEADKDKKIYIIRT